MGFFLPRRLGERPPPPPLYVYILLMACVVSKLNDLPFFEALSAWVISLYTFLFASLILCFEGCGTWSLCGNVIARNFGLMFDLPVFVRFEHRNIIFSNLVLTGFMYTVPGRLGFMFMAGVIVCSLRNNFSYTVCAITITAAFYNAGVMLAYPDWSSKVSSKRPNATLCTYLTKKAVRFLLGSCTPIFICPAQMMARHQEALARAQGY